MAEFTVKPDQRLGRYLTLAQFCTCTQTYRQLADRIQPWPTNPDSVTAIAALCQHLLDPLIDHFGLDNFQLTYGFCSADLKRYLAQTDPATGQKRGRVDPSRDQHMAHERNRNGRFYCPRLGAACDFRVREQPSDRVITWILAHRLPFDSLYFYGRDRPLHLSYGPEHKRAIWTFTPQGTPTRRGLDTWLARLPAHDSS